MGWQAEDVAFWFLIACMLGLALWLFHGSPTVFSAFIAIIIFVAGSESLIWRKIYTVDKRTAVGFEKVKRDLETNFLKLKHQYEDIKKDLDFLKKRR